MGNQKISYAVRDFASLRTELINYTQTYYPDLINDFNDASIFSVILDLNAAIGDNLHYHIDRSIQETVLQFAQQKSSIYSIARTYGLKIPGQRPSVSLVDFSIVVPAFGDKEDLRYCGILKAGSQVSGAGIVFENPNDIDFSSNFNSDGYVNRLKIPNFDGNGNLLNYTITKREVVVNGITKVFKRVITSSDIRPFLELFLPENNVLGITSVLLLDGTNYVNVPTNDDFLGAPNRWYEVNALVEDLVFIPDPTKVSDQAGIKVGQYVQTNSRFITEFTPEGFLKMTFGGGTISSDYQLSLFAANNSTLGLENYLNNFSLGSALKSNSTLFVQYRVGGGLTSNVSTNSITQIGNVTFNVNGPSSTINTSVVNSLSCTNPIAALGGANYPTVEEVRNFVAFNFAAQERAVTVNDYQAILREMPSQFGAPAKVAITEQENKVYVQILSYDDNGKLTEIVSNTLQSNIAKYLSNYRMLNDYIFVESAQVIDLTVALSVVLQPSQNQGSVVANLINIVSGYLDPTKRQLGQNVYVSEIRQQLQVQNGVITVTDISIFNNVGGQYSSSQTSQPYLDPTTMEIDLIDDTIFAQPNQIYQVRFPNTDITVSVKDLTTVNFS